MDICGDNRFEIIAKAKSDFLEATNIALSKDAMKVLDNFLFRCWQIGWLDRYATADTPQTEICDTCKYRSSNVFGNWCVGRDTCDRYEADTPQTDCGWGEPK